MTDAEAYHIARARELTRARCALAVLAIVLAFAPVLLFAS